MSDIPYYAGGVDRNLLRALAVLRCANQEKVMSDEKLKEVLEQAILQSVCIGDAVNKGRIIYKGLAGDLAEAIHQSGLKLVPADAVVQINDLIIEYDKTPDDDDDAGWQPPHPIFQMAEEIDRLRGLHKDAVVVPMNDLLEFCKAARDFRELTRSSGMLQSVRHDRLEQAEKRIGELLAPHKKPLLDEQREGCMSKQDGGPAFPTHYDDLDTAREGMTIRDYFATHAPAPPKWFMQTQVSALQRAIANQRGYGGDFKATEAELKELKAKRFIEWRWKYADLMLEARE